MDAELKAKWVEALRSGKYKQGGGFLRQEASDEDCFCCLGVLCDVMAPNEWEKREGQRSLVHPLRRNRLDEEVLSYTALKRAGLSEQRQRRLARLNDGGSSFDLIADFIEQNL